MNTLKELITKLKNNSQVIGLIEYGNASYTSKDISGDYDLIVILKEYTFKMESIHFYINNIPIDLNIRTLDDIKSIDKAIGFNSIFIEGSIIYDITGDIEKEINLLKVRSIKKTEIDIKSIGEMRFGSKHILDKLKNRKETMPILSAYLLYQGMYWLIIKYFKIRSLDYKGEKNSLEYLRINEPYIYKNVSEFYTTLDRDYQIELYKKIAEAILKPIGGLWKQNEVLGFGEDYKKADEIFGILFELNREKSN